MRVLRHPRIDQDIEINHDVIYNLIVENPEWLRKVLYALESQIVDKEEFFIFQEGVKQLDLSKKAFMVWNPLKIEFDEKKLDVVIQKAVATHITEEQREKYQLLLQAVNEYIESLSYSYPFPLTFASDLGLQSFLKSVSLTPIEESEDFLERLIFRIRKVSYGFGYDIFFFLNLHDYLNEEEMNKFLKEMVSLELYPVLISSHTPKYKIDKEFCILIDDDLCELHIENQN